MESTVLHVRRLAVAAALLGVVAFPWAVSAQSELDASEAAAFMGEWSITLESPQGPLEFPLEIADQDGKVAANVGTPDFGGGGAGETVAVTDIARSGEGLVLSYEFDAAGNIVPVSLTLTPDGEGLTAVFDIANGAFSMSGTGTRASN